MSTSRFRASEIAADQVEQIVAAAQEAAAKIRGEAKAAREQARRQGERDAEEILDDARREAEATLHEARKQAIMFTQDARRDADGILSDARAQAEQMRLSTERAVEGRVAAAEKAAAEVLAESRALSGGLRQLGRSLEDHAERILRDVTAAHKRMQADLRVGRSLAPEPERGAREEGAGPPGAPGRLSAPRRGAPRAVERSGGASRRTDEGAGDPASQDPGEREGEPRRPNPFEELEVPRWVAPDG